MLRRTRDVLAEAADMLDGPEPKEDWSAWRIRSMALAKRLRVELRREDAIAPPAKTVEACERHVDCDAADREAQDRTGDNSDHGPVVEA